MDQTDCQLRDQGPSMGRSEWNSSAQHLPQTNRQGEFLSWRWRGENKLARLAHQVDRQACLEGRQPLRGGPHWGGCPGDESRRLLDTWWTGLAMILTTTTMMMLMVIIKGSPWYIRLLQVFLLRRLCTFWILVFTSHQSWILFYKSRFPKFRFPGLIQRGNSSF